MSHDLKPTGAGPTTGRNSAMPSPNPPLLPLESLARALDPLAPGSAADVAALCLEFPPLDLTPPDEQWGVTPTHPAIDVSALASNSEELGSLVTAYAPSPTIQEEWSAKAPRSLLSDPTEHQASILAPGPGARGIL